MQRYTALIDIHTGGPRYDVTPLFADPAAFAELVEDLVRPFAGEPPDCVAGIDALGFILGTAVALRLKTGFVPIRKGGKLPGRARRAEFVDYSGQRKQLELRADALRPGQRVLIVDEWVETGAQVAAAAALIEGQAARVAGIATINLDDCEATRRLREKYVCHAVWQAP